jgi:aerobic-type carbon monoxide dehydrogenase small subunit (CoxS/CutS family)
LISALLVRDGGKGSGTEKNRATGLPEGKTHDRGETAMAKQTVTVTVNGARYQRDVEPRMLLSDFIRHELSLTGTHVGCEHGVCGTCTVLVDGAATRSCLCLAVQADGLSIETVESLGKVGALSPLQHAFWEKHGLQCGFCTPGMLMSLTELLRANPAPDREAIVEAIGGNLCRCTGYQNIIAAVDHAVELLRAPKEAA